MIPLKQVPRGFWPVFIALLQGIAAALPAQAAVVTDTEELIGLSLEELLQVQVTTLSRKPQTMSGSPAAVFVISQKDIQQSGARTLPDILRMVPGVQVAQVDANTWAVTARGSNGIFANKLLVLQDGRSLYGPMFSGVRWDAQDTDLSSIERIEVIRGPGAVMWGSNAVNGVINVITKSAADTQGLKADVAVGSFTNLDTTVRWGGKAGDDVSYRVFASYFDRDGFANDTNGDGRAHDDWDFGRAGGRVDWRVSSSDTIRASAELYDGSVGENVSSNSVTPPFSHEDDISTKPSGGFLSMNWNHRLSDTSELSVQVNYDHTERPAIAPEEDREALNLDVSHRFAFGSRHDFIWGFEARRSKDSTTGSETIALDPANRTHRLYSAFVQDEIRLVGDELFLTLGAKVEHNDFSRSQAEWSPNARLAWLMDDNTTLWGSVAKAVRTPNRIEQNVRILGGVVPPLTPGNPDPVPFAITINGNPDFDSEELIAYEIGFRTRPMKDMTVDVAMFYNDYKNLRWAQSSGVTCQPAGLPVSNPLCFAGPFDYAELPLTFVNQGRQDTKGFELALSYMPTDWWRLFAAYSYLKIDGDDFSTLPLSFGEDSPEHQLSLRSNTNIRSFGSLDLWLRYVGKLNIQTVPDYLTLDARLSWQVTDAFEVALIGRNLLESSHLEFREEFGANASVEVQREALAELVWQF